MLGLGDGENIGGERTEAAEGGVRVEKVREVRRGLVVEGFIGELEEFEVDVMWDREPVLVLKGRGDMVTGVGVIEEVGCRILDTLGFIEDFGGCATFAVAVVKAGFDKGVDQDFSGSDGGGRGKRFLSERSLI